MLAEISLNLYHAWGYVDETCEALDQRLDEFSKDLGLPKKVLKIIRTLGFLDGVSLSIFGSFCHPDHPIQVDRDKKIEWILSLKNILHQWHAWFHLFLQQEIKNIDSRVWKNKIIDYPNVKINYIKLSDWFNKSLKNEKKELKKMFSHFENQHASLLFHKKESLIYWRKLQAILIHPKFIFSITEDQHIDPIKQKYAYIEPFFRGIHQMLEISMNVVVEEVKQLKQEINQLKIIENPAHICFSEQKKISVLRLKMQHIQDWWKISAEHIMLLSKMDTGSYAEYRQALLGTSGGDSKQLRQLKNLISELHFSLSDVLLPYYTSALMKNSTDPLLNQLLSSIRELQAAASDFWLRHFTLTANTIGMVRGSQGLPVEKLISFAVAPLMRTDSLLQMIGRVGEHYAEYPEAFLVKINQQEKIVGKTIFSHVKNQLNSIDEYRTAKIPNTPLLDLFELRPLELDDLDLSPYAGWFKPDIHASGLRFTMHSFGAPLIFFQESITKTTHRLMEFQESYWGTFFSDRIRQFENILFKLLDISSQYFTVTIDSNVTALLERLLSALPSDENAVVLTTTDEFLTVKRALAAGVLTKQFQLEQIEVDENELDIASLFCEAIQKIKKSLKLVIFSEVMSASQLSLTPSEINRILDEIPPNVPVVIDITQGVFNVPISWNEIIKNRKNIYLLGSAIKHGRSTSGLAFLIYPRYESLLKNPKKTGWCAYLSGLAMGCTTDQEGNLLYDEELQWFGGTPGNIFSLELFINTWDSILRSGETLQSMHRYVKKLQDYFLSCMGKQSDFQNRIQIVDSVRRRVHSDFCSNTVTLQLTGYAKHLVQYAEKQGVYLDYRNDFIRIGFGIQHGRKDIRKLTSILFSFMESTQDLLVARD